MHLQSRFNTTLKDIKLIDENSLKLLLVADSPLLEIRYFIIKGGSLFINTESCFLQEIFAQVKNDVNIYVDSNLTMLNSFIEANSFEIPTTDGYITIQSTTLNTKEKIIIDSNERIDISTDSGPQDINEVIFDNNYYCKAAIKKCICPNNNDSSKLIIRRR